MSRTGMMQRFWEHDYCARCFYLITIVTEPRRESLGVLRVEDDGVATVAISRMGEVVRDVWRQQRRQTMTREQCRELNKWARQIVINGITRPQARSRWS